MSARLKTKIDKLIGPVTGLLDVIEDKDQKARLAHDLATMADNHAQELAKAQLEVNKVEAAHHSLFVSPFGVQRSDGLRARYVWELYHYPVCKLCACAV